MKDQIAEQLKQVLNELIKTKNLEGEITQDQILMETPPRPEMGDLSFPMFPFAKIFRSNPAQIAGEVQALLTKQDLEAKSAGPYVNVFLPKQAVIAQTIVAISNQAQKYGHGTNLADQKIMVEFSSPNTNKPLHLGHLRNDILGETVSRLLLSQGADVKKVNLINDRGVHICKSMLAYDRWGEGKTPESEGKKSDHFIGDYYVKFAQEAAKDENLEKDAQAMLKKWEENDPHVISLWEKMRAWAIEGLKKTYERTKITFDEYHAESENYLLGKDKILEGLDAGVFYKDDSGAVWIDLEEIKLDKKVLLRSDGTSLYMTQDVGTVLKRHEAFPFNRMIYVVGSEQDYHFKVLFYIMKKLGHDFADGMYHLSYGMVNLTEGKMKSREGTVVDGDDLVEKLSTLALEEIKSKEREDALANPEEIAESVALAALNYYLLQNSPKKDMIFNPKESLSFTGNTGPYLQYTGARISSVMRKFGSDIPEASSINWSALDNPEEWNIILLLHKFPQLVTQAAEQYNPSILCGFCYDLAKTFSRYYHDVPIGTEKDQDKKLARLVLVKSIKQVLMNSFDLLNLPFLVEM
jgi:arginyl-tRNA synthetase